jgi:hypothetical protein
MHAAVLTRPTNVKAFFQAQFRSLVPSQPVAPGPTAVPIRRLPDDDPYGF